VSRSSGEYMAAMQSLRERKETGEFCEQMIVELQRAHLHLGDYVVDGGAAQLRHSIACAVTVGPSGKVFAYEPVEEYAPKMAEAVRVHLVPRGLAHVVDIRRKALSNENGLSEYTTVPDHFGLSGLKKSTTVPVNVKTKVTQVNKVRLDDD